MINHARAWRWLVSTSLLVGFSLVTRAAVFEEQTHSLPNVCYGAFSLCDYDLDGKLDVFMLGSVNPGNSRPLTELYRNEGNFVFTLVTNTSFIPASSGSSAWADLNGDGRPDVVYVGYTNATAATTLVYLNRGNGVFELLQTGLPGNNGFATVSLADFDRDGYPDVLLAGVRGSYDYSVRLFRNQGGQSFVEAPAGLGSGAFAVWGDYNSDGYPDILKASLQAGRMAQVLRNNGDGTFTDINAGLDPIADGSHGAWGDYDNDGKLDILLTGWDGYGNNRLARVYHNNGDGTFTRAFTGLTGTDRIPTARWGDYDADGFLDILITGFHLDQVGPVSRVFHNNQDGTFSDIGAGLQPLNELVGVWGDLDGDGDLDIIIGGTPQNDLSSTATVYSTKVYRNTTQNALVPEITLQPTNQVLLPNQSIDLVVGATGMPSPSFQWMKDQQPILGATNSTLTLSNFTASAAGSYSVVVSNVAGVVTSAVCRVTLAPTELDLALFAGVILTGPVGAMVDIQAADSPEAVAWDTLETLTLARSPMVWVDLNSPGRTKRFYRVRYP